MIRRTFMTIGASSFLSFSAFVTLARSFFFLKGLNDITGNATQAGPTRTIAQSDCKIVLSVSFHKSHTVFSRPSCFRSLSISSRDSRDEHLCNQLDIFESPR